MIESLQERMHKGFPKILDFFSGFFVGVGIVGGGCCFFLLAAFTSAFLSFLIGLGVLCVFVFFGIISKALSILLKNAS